MSAWAHDALVNRTRDILGQGCHTPLTLELCLKAADTIGDIPNNAECGWPAPPANADPKDFYVDLASVETDTLLALHGNSAARLQAAAPCGYSFALPNRHEIIGKAPNELIGFIGAKQLRRRVIGIDDDSVTGNPDRIGEKLNEATISLIAIARVVLILQIGNKPPQSF
jgi:hypothetical protein